MPHLGHHIGFNRGGQQQFRFAALDKSVAPGVDDGRASKRRVAPMRERLVDLRRTAARGALGLSVSLIAVLLSLVVGSLLIVSRGHSPLEVYGVLA